MVLAKNVVVKFGCSDFRKEQVVIAREELPTSEEGLIFHRANLPKGTAFSVELNYGRESLDSMSDQLPVDWSNPVEWAFEGYSQTDKGVLEKVPFAGPVLEHIAPDAKWNFDLWYDFQISESGKLEYKIHFGPTSNVGVRKKLEGTLQLQEDQTS